MPGNQLNKIDTVGFIDLFNFENADKIVHVCMFFGLAFLYQFLKDKPIFYYFLVPFFISFLIEILQGIMPFGRSFDWLDLIANSIGILLAVGLVQSIKKAKN